jgi:hypothetical protein
MNPTTTEIIKAYQNNDKSALGKFIQLIAKECETAVILQQYKPRHQWESKEFQLFADEVRKRI